MTSTILHIDKLAHDLRGMAQADGLTWFVEDALPQERVQIRELARFQGRVEAVAVQVLDAAPERVPPVCEYTQQCGGCSTQHIDHDAQIAFKQKVLQEQWVRIGKLPSPALLPPLSASPFAYRRRTRLACKWLADRKHLAVGYRQRHSHDIVEIAHCAVLLSALQNLLPALRDCLSRWSQPRQLGHVELLQADNGIGMLLRVMAEPSASDLTRLQQFAEQHQVSIYLQKESHGQAQWLCGAVRTLYVGHAATQTTLSCLPGDFLQGNAAVNTLLIDTVLAALQLNDSDKVLEAFSGLGNFTFPLAARAGEVFALEMNAAMLARAEQQARETGISHLHCQVSDLSAVASYHRHWPACNKILLDPPRDGAQTFCRQVSLDGVERIVYVSCNPATLARDAAILAERGFSAESLRMVDMFPQTSHIEALAVFQRNLAVSNKPLQKKPAAKTLKKLKR